MECMSNIDYAVFEENFDYSYYEYTVEYTTDGDLASYQVLHDIQAIDWYLTWLIFTGWTVLHISRDLGLWLWGVWRMQGVHEERGRSCDFQRWSRAII